MKTTATNRRVGVLLTVMREGRLVPNPSFQRRLVWKSKDKQDFLKTVLDGFPFPEIYIALGEINLETGEGTEMLVDGQQRLTTLNQYFTGSPEIEPTKDFPPYSKLSYENKSEFLEYDVVIRDLGSLTINQIRSVFRRINSISYSLNAWRLAIHDSMVNIKSAEKQLQQIHFLQTINFLVPMKLEKWKTRNSF